ncbi:uncharacterized protein LOC125941141 [Dermacentor silvarum]|uniref:uncharacterized protein LOC125941141 n=1 Tax=Dermacentor silvarum TaxID=543639 RepID=UPI002100B8E8|nr:uncharacterized protein LOC125941141 [Dermacentor silvarum]
MQANSNQQRQQDQGIRTNSKPPPRRATPPLPDNDYKVVYRPRTGMKLSSWPDDKITEGLARSLYASLPSLVSESLRWASLVSLAFGWTEVVHRPLPTATRRTMTVMDGVFTLFNVGSSVTMIRQAVYMVREKENLFDICSGITRTAAASFASAVVLVTLSLVAAWRNKREQPCSAYIWCVLGLLATAAMIDAVALEQHLWSMERMVLSDFNYQRGVVLAEVLAVFFLLGSFLSTGLRDRTIFKSDDRKSKERLHDDTSSPFGVFVCWPLRTHLANVVLHSKVVTEDVPLLPHRFKCGPLLRQLSNRLSEGCLCGRDLIQQLSSAGAPVVRFVEDSGSTKAPSESSVNSIFNDYHDVFSVELGLIKDPPASLHMKEGAVPKFCREFTLVTDHQPLLCLLTSDKQTPTMATARIQRWALHLGVYRYRLQYAPGRQILNADALADFRSDLRNLTTTPFSDCIDVGKSAPCQPPRKVLPR